MTEDNQDEPKIIVDEDWKEQVQQEKQQLNEGDQADGPAPEEEGEIPPASFLSLLSMLGAQAMGGLGVLPDPMTGKPRINRPLAKHFIDTLGILEEKTKGNLTDEEAAHLRDALHQLRMMFVAVKDRPDADSSDQGPSSSIELP
jgi:hypothetical protein